LRHGIRQNPLCLLPTLRDVQQIAGLVGQDVAMLSGDSIIANPATAVRALEGGGRGVDSGQKCIEVLTAVAVIQPLIFNCPIYVVWRRARERQKVQ
jgi:hypothetical protein